MTTQISDWDDLDAVRTDLDGDYELVADLDQNTSGYAGIGDDWTPISITSSDIRFDGGGHAIEDLVITSATDSRAGLFAGGFQDGDNEPTVTDLFLDVSIPSTSAGYVGGIAGLLGTDSQIKRCGVAIDAPTSAEFAAGGLVGRMDGDVTESYAIGSVEGADDVGGLVGTGVNTGPVIEDVFAAVDVSASSSDPDLGAIASSWSGDVRDAYYDETIESSAFGIDPDTEGATGLTTAEMQGDDAADTMGGLAFGTTWSRVEGGENADADDYPLLRTVGVDRQAAPRSASITDYRLVPIGLSATPSNDPDADGPTVTLSWTDSAVGEGGYRVYRSDVASPSFPGDYTQIAETIPDVESYADDGVAFDTDYAYRVVAFDADGEATPRASTSATVGSPGPFTVTIVGTNSPVGVGDTLAVDLEITNQGDLRGDVEAAVDLTEQ